MRGGAMATKKGFIREVVAKNEAMKVKKDVVTVRKFIDDTIKKNEWDEKFHKSIGRICASWQKKKRIAVHEEDWAWFEGEGMFGNQ